MYSDIAGVCVADYSLRTGQSESQNIIKRLSLLPESALQPLPTAWTQQHPDVIEEHSLASEISQ